MYGQKIQPLKSEQAFDSEAWFFVAKKKTIVTLTERVSAVLDPDSDTVGKGPGQKEAQHFGVWKKGARSFEATPVWSEPYRRQAKWPKDRRERETERGQCTLANVQMVDGQKGACRGTLP